MATKTATKAAKMTHTLACGHCGRVLVVRRGVLVSERGASQDILLRFWCAHMVGGHPRVFALLTERMEGIESEAGDE